jgi:hypothetical protein
MKADWQLYSNDAFISWFHPCLLDLPLIQVIFADPSDSSRCWQAYIASDVRMVGGSTMNVTHVQEEFIKDCFRVIIHKGLLDYLFVNVFGSQTRPFWYPFYILKLNYHHEFSHVILCLCILPRSIQLRSISDNDRSCYRHLVGDPTVVISHDH